MKQEFSPLDLLVELEDIQLELVHGYERLAREKAGDVLGKLEYAVQWSDEFHAEVIRQLHLAIELLSGPQRDSKRAARRVHRVASAIHALVRSGYLAPLETCFPPHFVRMTVTDGDHIVSDDEIPPDP